MACDAHVLEGLSMPTPVGQLLVGHLVKCLFHQRIQ